MFGVSDAAGTPARAAAFPTFAALREGKRRRYDEEPCLGEAEGSSGYEQDAAVNCVVDSGDGRGCECLVDVERPGLDYWRGARLDCILGVRTGANTNDAL